MSYESDMKGTVALPGDVPAQIAETGAVLELEKARPNPPGKPLGSQRLGIERTEIRVVR